MAHGGTTNFRVVSDVYYHISSILTNGAAVSGTFGQLTTNVVVTWVNVLSNGTVVAHMAESLATNRTPEWWLASYYGWTNDFDSAAMSDTDHDGMRAWQERVAGTDPTNAASRLQIDRLTVTNGSNYLRWASATGSWPYNIWMSTGLLGGWIEVTNGLPPNPPTNWWWQPTPGVSPVFYRIMITN